jgi:hypothetical protein
MEFITQEFLQQHLQLQLFTILHEQKILKIKLKMLSSDGLVSGN